VQGPVQASSTWRQNAAKALSVPADGTGCTTRRPEQVPIPQPARLSRAPGPTRAEGVEASGATSALPWRESSPSSLPLLRRRQLPTSHLGWPPSKWRGAWRVFRCSRCATPTTSLCSSPTSRAQSPSPSSASARTTPPRSSRRSGRRPCALLRLLHYWTALFLPHSATPQSPVLRGTYVPVPVPVLCLCVPCR